MTGAGSMDIGKKESEQLFNREERSIGTPFGAPGYMRISYGNVSSDKVIDRLLSGLTYLRDAVEISQSEQKLAELLNTIIS